MIRSSLIDNGCPAAIIGQIHGHQGKKRHVPAARRRLMQMINPPAADITQLLRAWGEGDEAALEQLVPLVNHELRRLARRYITREHAGHTLQASALVNEAYVRLIDWHNACWEDRAHFFAVAARLMRRTLVDYARRRRYQKRGGDAITISLDDVTVAHPERSADLIAVDEALKNLAQFDARKSQIVELRFFGGLTVEETAEVLRVSPRTVKREWQLARAWLYVELAQEKPVAT